jgi:hypothetical protein
MPQVTDEKIRGASHSVRLQVGLYLALTVVIPIATVWIHSTLAGSKPELFAGGSNFPSSSRQFQKHSLGTAPTEPAYITHVQIIDFDRDGRNDVVACDARHNRVVWFQQTNPLEWDEKTLASDLPAPAHATVVDLDADGDSDVVVSVLGNIWPDDGVIGRLLLLENTPTGFVTRVLLDDVRRVADAQPGDFDSDGDLDLAVAVFGYAHGEVLWLQNEGDFRFRRHALHWAPGAIHVPVADYDRDGDLDIAAVISQDEEEVRIFENSGAGSFLGHPIYTTSNFDLGSAGLVQADLDQDGDADLVLPVGDNLEDEYGYPQPYHGCLWLENLGNWQFTPKRIAQFGGTYAAAVGDVNADGHVDVVLVSMLNEWDRPGRASIVWLENDGRQNFRTWQVDSTPTHLVTVSCGDLDGDGQTDLVAGGLHLLGPYDQLGRVTGWFSGGGKLP